ncbi:hypothetical protein KUCAC02_014740, partial [Chaenocephalus aceratus]
LLLKGLALHSGTSQTHTDCRTAVSGEVLAGRPAAERSLQHASQGAERDDYTSPQYLDPLLMETHTLPARKKKNRLRDNREKKNNRLRDNREKKNRLRDNREKKNRLRDKREKKNRLRDNREKKNRLRDKVCSALTSPPHFISPSAERQVNRPTALSREARDSNPRGQGAPVIRAAVLPGLRRGQGHRALHLKQVLP